MKRGLDTLLIDKGTICNTIYHFPERLKFFSTADLLEFPGVPMIISGDKPTRHEAMNYFTRLALANKLPIATFETVSEISKRNDEFHVRTNRRSLRAKWVVLATGTYDFPNLLNVPGEEFDKVSHYHTSPQPYIGRKVLVVGGKNSAVEAALELYRAGADVTMLHRAELRTVSIKYWLLPDILNRLEEGVINHFWNSSVQKIEQDRVLTLTPNGEQWIENDFVLALIGYHPDWDFLKGVGMDCSGEAGAPVHDPETLESNIPGIYIAGVLTSGANPSKVFIENSRHHGEMIVRHLMNPGWNATRRPRPVSLPIPPFGGEERAV